MYGRRPTVGRDLPDVEVVDSCPCLFAGRFRVLVPVANGHHGVDDEVERREVLAGGRVGQSALRPRLGVPLEIILNDGRGEGVYSIRSFSAVGGRSVGPMVGWLIGSVGWSIRRLSVGRWVSWLND